MDDYSDSAYSSAASSRAELPEFTFTPSHIRFLNTRLQSLSPQEILQWCVLTIPRLHQTTAFGLSGLVTIDMLSKLEIAKDTPVPLIFLDTLHHFPETLELVERIRQRYPGVPLHVYKPNKTDTAEAFAETHGQNLWESNETLYDYLVKVEPAQRAYDELQVKAVLTGRRKSQGGKRGSLQILEMEDTGVLKINPLANWSFAQVKAYIDENNVPYNKLLDRGYRSVGDWHSTAPVKEGEDERAGRWKGREKTECGLHENSRFGRLMLELDRQRQAAGEAVHVA